MQQPPPPANILTPCLQPPIHLVSVIPSQHPTEPYHTWTSHSGSGQTGLDHILAAPEHIYPECSCGIDRELSRAYLKSNHFLIYATFALSCPNTAPTPPSSTRYHYRKVSSIPLIKTYPAGPNDNSPPWFAPKTLGILPADVNANAKMHDALVLAHEHTLVQHHLLQASQHLTQLDLHTATLYIAHQKRIPKPHDADLTPRTTTSRRLINKACVSWKMGIEQMMTTAKLVTRQTPRKHAKPTTKRKTKHACRLPQGAARVTYRAMFNTINSTLAKHVTLSVTLKQCDPIFLTVNQPHITLLNSLMRSILDKHNCEASSIRYATTRHPRHTRDTDRRIPPSPY